MVAGPGLNHADADADADELRELYDRRPR